jgi:hypothetical protein
VNAADGQKTGPSDQTRRASRYGQIGTASLVSLAHGTNDAQKTMGVITLALVVHGTLEDASAVPFWVKLVAAASIALGTYIGGWRIIRTLGSRLTQIEPPQGFVAEGTSTSVLLASSFFGYRSPPRRSSRAACSASAWASAWRRCAGAWPAAWPLRGTSDMFATVVDFEALWKIVLVAVCGAICLAALVLGLIAMTHK